MKPIAIVKDTEYTEMYRLRWKDGVLSEDFYNLTRANDILNNYDEYIRNMKMRSNTRARKSPGMALDCIA